MRNVVFLFLATILVACNSSEAKTSPAPQKDAGPRMLKLDVGLLGRLGVTTESVGADGDAERIELPGTLEYVVDQYAEVGTFVEGRVTRVNVNVGDVVKKGQTLATVLVPAIVSAQADALSAISAHRMAVDHAKREAFLLEKQLTTAREEEVARGEVARAAADLAAARSKLTLYGTPSPVDADGIKANGSLVLTAPLAGVVVRRDAVLGAFISPNETAFVVANTDTLWAVLDVYESDLAFVREGASVEVKVDALPNTTVTGRVAMIEPEVSKATRALRARIIVDNHAGALRQGFFVRALVPIWEPSRSGLMVPAAAVQPLGERDVVFVEKAPGQYEVRDVAVRRRTPHVAELTDGLARGERIVTHGAFVLRGEATRQ
ncbi:MAG TPA: efflux RND transporter periplasmic adaptor subunit [Polyangiaceae bacterium]|jgi:cobalt-zinc-cadmium efflux system membrane fusion protein|nr:efflux RND transporter periplasmic adaptor subunit [Polyangiaceae bacterium]